MYFIAVGTYIPRKEVVVDETVRATVIKPNQAIKLRARKETLVSKLYNYLHAQIVFSTNTQYFYNITDESLFSKHSES